MSFIRPNRPSSPPRTRRPRRRRRHVHRNEGRRPVVIRFTSDSLLRFSGTLDVLASLRLKPSTQQSNRRRSRTASFAHGNVATEDTAEEPSGSVWMPQQISSRNQISSRRNFNPRLFNHSHMPTRRGQNPTLTPTFVGGLPFPRGETSTNILANDSAQLDAV